MSGIKKIAALGSLMMFCGHILAATLSSQSSIGVMGEYATNPFQLASGAHAAESLALVANLPLTYNGETQTIDLIPRFRLAQSFGQAVLSNYEYLDGDWHWNSARDSFVLSGFWHNDSTYYNQFENAALLGHDVRRLEQYANLAWQRSLDERSSVQLAGSWDKSAYGQSSVLSVSTYTYAQGALQFNRSLSELWQSTTSAGYGRYQLADGSYSSDERFAQTALQRILSERWSMTGQVGYAYLSAHALGYVCCQILEGPAGFYLQEIPVKQVSSQGAPNYSLTVEHKDERLTIDLAASRSIVPSGLGALLTEDNASASANMPWTERLTVGTTLQWARLSDTLDHLSLLNRRYYELDLNADWQWTEKWTVELHTSYVLQYLAPQAPGAPDVTVYLSLLRQLGQLRL